MTDRELLELAAKAIGGRITQWGNETTLHDAVPYPIEWNPLSDDSDALRLAVRLEMDVSFGLRGAVVEQSHGRKVQELDDNEPYVATRRAIVRAAAEVGRSMK
jgi:hypothetical protein